MDDVLTKIRDLRDAPLADLATASLDAAPGRVLPAVTVSLGAKFNSAI
jgi:hypothetical protein